MPDLQIVNLYEGTGIEDIDDSHIDDVLVDSIYLTKLYHHTEKGAQLTIGRSGKWMYL